MKELFADLHIHIGRSARGKPIKITAAQSLTFENILHESYYRKGLDMVGIVDGLSPFVQEDIEAMLDRGMVRELDKGGLIYQESLVVILGGEIETEEGGHFLFFFPTLRGIQNFSRMVEPYITNISLSSQRAKLKADVLARIALEVGGIVIPAHIFTPHKGVLGYCCKSLEEIFSKEVLKQVLAVELGLSADTYFAEQIEGLIPFTYLTNSDAHSLPKIGREYNQFMVAESNFAELVMALKAEKGRKVTKNFGLDPRLGKYCRSYCLDCERVLEESLPSLKCPTDPKHRITKGVWDRIRELAPVEREISHNRPKYIHQIPLQFIPGLGPKTLEKLYKAFGTEMNILHRIIPEKLEEVVGSKIARNIILGREGNLKLLEGGGGNFGRIVDS